MLEEIRKALKIAEWKMSSIAFFIFKVESLLKENSKITSAEIDRNYAEVIIDNNLSVEMRRA